LLLLLLLLLLRSLICLACSLPNLTSICKS